MFAKSIYAKLNLEKNNLKMDTKCEWRYGVLCFMKVKILLSLTVYKEWQFLDGRGPGENHWLPVGV